jgi:hypothetical protein
MTAEEWLEKHGFFCERLKARIAPATCLLNQERAHKGDRATRQSWNETGAQHGSDRITWHCFDCEQGKRIAEQNICPHCGTSPKLPGMNTCDQSKCKAKEGRIKVGETVKITKSETSSVEKKPATTTCTECGAEVTPWKAGAVTISKLCRDCWRKRQTTYCQKAAKTKKHYESMRVTVDFEGRIDLLDGLRRMAESEFRTPDLQILAIVAEALERAER